MKRRDFLKLGSTAILTGCGLNGCGGGGNSSTSNPPSPDPGPLPNSSAVYINPSALSGGSGTLMNPYSLEDFIAVWNTLSGDLGGKAYLFKSDTFGRLPAMLINSCGNYTMGYYGTGAKPILASSTVMQGTWMRYDSNTWYTSHPRFKETFTDSFCYGGQRENGVVSNPGFNPYGNRLTQQTSLQDCQNTALTSYYDTSTEIVYVNLGGLNPNEYVMEYTANKYVLFANHVTTGNIILDSLRFANGYDSNLFMVFPAPVDNLQLLDIEVDQGGSYSSVVERTDWGGAQIIGPYPGNGYITNMIVNNFKATNSIFAGLTLLGIKGGQFYNVQISDCGQGMGTWNDVTDCEFTRGRISNIRMDNKPCYARFSVGQYTPYGLYAPAVGTGGINGREYRNRYAGYEVVNCEYSALKIECGSGWVFENNTFLGTSAQGHSFNGNGDSVLVVFSKNGSSPFDNIEATFSNNVLLNDATSIAQRYHLLVGPSASHMVHGDNNIYASMNGTWFRNFVYDTEYRDFATYQASVSAVGLDANSQWIPNSDPGFVNPGGFSTPGGVFLGPQWLGWDFTPQTVSAGYSSDSVMVGAGDILHATNSTPPLPPVLTGAQGLMPRHVRITYVTLNGETLPSEETTLLVSGNGFLKVYSPTAQNDAIGWNVYASATSGAETKQNSVPIAIGSDWMEPYEGIVTGPLVPSVPPPQMPSADSNGKIFDPNNMPIGAVQP